MNQPAIRVSEVSKLYRKGLGGGYALIKQLREGLTGKTFWALRDVSFEVKKGELFGIVGHNGAGKSTLLKVLSRLTRPNLGYAELQGRIGSLLEVGTGFHSELTGRENIFFNGALLGMRTAEIKRNLERIVEFSGVGEYLDTPIKRYSSGMNVRLGFAIASHLEQEILLVDEVLAVGDTAFREKCLGRIDEITHGGRTVVLVGHNASVIAARCERAMLLGQGRIQKIGKASEVVHSYLETLAGLGRMGEGFVSFGDLPQKLENNSVRLSHMRLLDSEGNQVPLVSCGQYAEIAIGFEATGSSDLGGLSISITVENLNQQSIAVLESKCVREPFEELPPWGEFVCRIDRVPFMPGHYKLKVRCSAGSRTIHEIFEAGELTVTPGHFYSRELLPSSGAAEVLFDYDWSVS